MPADIVAAIDETAANTILHDAEAALVLPPATGNGSFGPLEASWSASVAFSGGTVSLAAPDTVSIDNLTVDYSLSLSVGIDLSFLDFCLPQICLSTPFGDFCTPTICFDFPTISVTVPFSSSLTISADFGLDVHLTSGVWFVDVVIQDVPELQLGAAATALVTAIGLAISAALLAIPFIGLILAAATAAITAAFGIADALGLLGEIVSPFVSGLTFNIYQQPQLFQVLPAGGPDDPAVDVTLTSVAADVQVTDKAELVLSVDI
jgi:hypothetical protein